MTTIFTILIIFCLLLNIVAAVQPRRLNSILAAIMALLVLGTYQIMGAQARKRAAESSMSEVSSGQYLTVASIARKSPEGRALVRRYLMDGRILWKEYAPIEQHAAAQMEGKARDDAIRSAGLMRKPRKSTSVQ